MMSRTIVMVSVAAAAVALLAAAHFSRSANSTEPVANVGTLTCVATPGEKDVLGPERKLSCTFEPLTGAKASFTGMIKRVGSQVSGEAKTVLVWAVLGPEIDSTASQLEGRYVGSLGEGRESNAAGLVGGAGGHIALRPLTLDANSGENAALAVLELQLAAMKA